MVDMSNGTLNSASMLFYLYFCDFVTNQSVVYMIDILTSCVCYFLKTHRCV